ncbi:MAG: YfcE family phosphodiesterase, partial [Candidatus Altiarchaeota archaeon]|nr:YfcE family phosphodiesterase [Candidatus Altiarchaeota archaeon]
GNNEGEREGLRDKFKGLCKLSDFIELEHNGKKICVYHGTIPFLLKALEESQIYDLVVSGHTHNPESRRTGNTLLVNPGECCGYLTGKKTVALVDSVDLSLEFVEL